MENNKLEELEKLSKCLMIFLRENNLAYYEVVVNIDFTRITRTKVNIPNIELKKVDDVEVTNLDKLQIHSTGNYIGYSFPISTVSHNHKIPIYS